MSNKRHFVFIHFKRRWLIDSCILHSVLISKFFDFESLLDNQMLKYLFCMWQLAHDWVLSYFRNYQLEDTSKIIISNEFLFSYKVIQ